MHPQPIQTTCTNCHRATWAYPGVATPCQTCRAPVTIANAPPPAMPAPSLNVGGFALPIGKRGGGVSTGKIVVGIVATIALGIGGYIVKSKLTKPKGAITYASLGIDKSAPNADELYKAVDKDAKRWMRDATFWSLNFYVRPDGTVDTSKPIDIAYISPSNSASASKRTRSNSIRKYGSNPKGLKTSSWGWNAPVKDIEPHPQPQCTIKQLMGKLSPKAPVRVMFEPKLADFYAWTVYGADKPVSYSWQDCSRIE
jgi:hypothetical protein